MADNRVSAFPLPPMQYVNQYTNERVANGTAPQPPAPLDSTFTMFGTPCAKEDAIIRSLESQGIRRLFPPLYDHKRELKKINFSILANYLDLLDILIESPDSSSRTEKLEDIRLLFINMHHLINEFRPLQARDALTEILQHQHDVTGRTLETAEKYIVKVDQLLDRANRELPDPAGLWDVDAFLFDLPPASHAYPVQDDPMATDDLDALLNAFVTEN